MFSLNEKKSFLFGLILTELSLSLCIFSEKDLNKYIKDDYNLIKLDNDSVLRTIQKIPGWTSSQAAQFIQQKLKTGLFTHLNISNIRRKIKEKIWSKKMILNFENWYLIDTKLYCNLFWTRLFSKSEK